MCQAGIQDGHSLRTLYKERLPRHQGQGTARHGDLSMDSKAVISITYILQLVP